jgi:sodium transport system permease protein
MVITTLILPGLMIYVMYSFMGNAITSLATTEESYQYKVDVVDMPESIGALTNELNFEITEIDKNDIDAVREELTEERMDILAVFPEGF